MLLAGHFVVDREFIYIKLGPEPSIVGQDLSQTLNLGERFRFLQSRASGVLLAPILTCLDLWRSLFSFWPARCLFGPAGELFVPAGALFGPLGGGLKTLWTFTIYVFQRLGKSALEIEVLKTCKSACFNFYVNSALGFKSLWVIMIHPEIAETKINVCPN